ncbi:argininosuccinate lyase [Elasticomyces elasticus]|nr:argininosuccinate lyase [Elasticomyces elasticus]
MDKLSFEQLQGVDKRFEKDIVDTFDYQRSVEMRSAKGGTSKSCVLEQIEVLKKTALEAPMKKSASDLLTEKPK